jgi:mono/diheme cytochrome c family protein
MTDTQKQGMLAYRQHCQVCHVRPMIGNSKYGPRLSREFVIGREGFVRKQIAEGSEHMPGFKYGLQAAQIDAIVEYLKTVDKADVADKGKTTNSDSSDKDN